VAENIMIHFPVNTIIFTIPYFAPKNAGVVRATNKAPPLPVKATIFIPAVLFGILVKLTILIEQGGAAWAF